MDNKKTKVKGRAQRVFILMIPIILAVIATVLLAMTMGGGFSTPTPTPMTDEPEATTRSDIPVGIDPENTPDTASKGLSFSVGADGNATVTGLGGCSDRVITVPTVTADGARVTAIADNAFAYATGITEVILPSGLVTIGDYAFRGSSIEKVTVVSSVLSIGKGAFADCKHLASIEVDGANPMYSSKGGVLFNSSGTSLICYPAGRKSSTYTIPKSVAEIADMAFRSCDSLTKIKYEGNKKEWERVSIGSGNSLLDIISVEVDSSDK